MERNIIDAFEDPISAFCFRATLLRLVLASCFRRLRFLLFWGYQIVPCSAFTGFRARNERVLLTRMLSVSILCFT
jgi:hypothetical protein